MSSESYNRATNLIIVCPITSTDKKRPFLVSVHNKSLSDSSKVNTNQIFSLDYTPQANRNVEMLGQLDEETFYQVAQNVLFSFDFPF
ncbi:hypothetical protein IV84_GL000863 [Pediococcus damnosus]|nr:hypothetical protein IV84_GL000863 [Pediococcus damnosus]